jgi:uncharacterized protein
LDITGKRSMNVILLPGLGNSGPDHWQSCWERQHPSFERLEQRDWDAPDCAAWVARLDAYLRGITQPVLLAAHSSACAVVARWAAGAAPMQAASVAGALLVAPTDPDGAIYPAGPVGFSPMALDRLPFRSIVVASDNDPYVTSEQAARYARAWGSDFVLLPGAGHINVSSAHDPWPEGMELLLSMSRDESRLSAWD